METETVVAGENPEKLAVPVLYWLNVALPMLVVGPEVLGPAPAGRPSACENAGALLSADKARLSARKEG